MTRNRHFIEFREQALSKVGQRGARSVQDVARDPNMSAGTLRKRTAPTNQKESVSLLPAQLPTDLPAQSWSPARRLLALNQTHTLSREDLHAWCRERGLFKHQLKALRDTFCSDTPVDSKDAK